MAILTVGTGYTYSTIQAAINAAVSGDIIKCKAGQLFTESLTLPNKGTLSSFITITTDANSTDLPAAGYRTSPSYAAFMPKIQSAGGGAPAVQTAAGANHYKFQHVEFKEVPQGFNSIIALGYGDSTQQFESEEPTDITIDQCYVHGGVMCGQKRGADINGKRLIITNNYIDKTVAVGQDSQCVAGWNGHGPVTVTNNYLGGATEPFILGGEDPWIRTFMSVSGTPTVNSAVVTCTGASHTLAEIAINQTIACLVGGVWKLTTVTSKSGNGTSGTIGFVALSAAPDVGTNTIKAGVICKGLTFRYNYVRNDPAWIDGIFPLRGSGPSVTPGTGGSLSAGTYYYELQDFTTVGYEGATSGGQRSPQTSGTVAASGKNTLSWSATTNADFVRVWRGTTSGVMTHYHDVIGTGLVDDGVISWTASSPTNGDQWVIKNLLELKAVEDAVVEYNIFENHWKGADVGMAIWLKTVDQGGSAPFLQSKNIQFRYNIIRHCFGFMSLRGIEAEHGGRPGPMTDVTVEHNLVYDSGTDPWRQANQCFAMSPADGLVNTTIAHNTVVHITQGSAGGAMQFDDQVALISGFVLRDNMMRGETYGFICSAGQGTTCLDAAAPGWSMNKNSIADVSSGSYPSNNFYPSAATWEAQFTAYSVNGSPADYAIASGSAYKNAGTDGLDIGADIAAIIAGTATVISGAPAGGASPDTPITPSPSDGASGVSVTPTLTWGGANATSYDVYLGTASSPPLVNASGGTQSYSPSTLIAGTLYYWRIVARNANGTTSGPTWTFTTAGTAPAPHRRHGRFHR